ncbi:MAG: elongation factor P [Candidatus Portnoybacteria bacterium]|nr:elongation factor P [Candidatus Portnoybacteria bacterium]
MLSYSDLKPGTVFLLDGQPYIVLEFAFLRMQQRKPVAQTKIKNLISGKIISRNFQPNETFQEAEINYRDVKFLYGHRGKYFFCEAENPSKRFELDEGQISELKTFLKPNSEVEIIEFEGKIININLPIKMDFKVIEAPPGIKGDTAQGGTKAVKIETGATINAPLFIEAGDIIRINTQTGLYTERVEKYK